jgi:flagellar hook assembly protein FlgD
LGSQILKLQTDFVPTGVDAPARSSFVLGQNHPNPFNPSTSISFQLPSPSHAVISIFDVRGSLVRTLVDETMSAGPHQVEWNGRDDGGNIVGSGVYFYRLAAGGHSQAKKMVILK